MRRTQTNEVQAIYNTVIRAQGVGKPFIVVMTEADHAAMHERARLDVEKIAQAAGVEMLKTASITVRRGMRQQQQKGLKELNTLLQEIRLEKTKKDVYTQTGIATGYANAMRHFDLISEKELKDVIEVIGQAGEQTARRIETANRPFWSRIFRKRGGGCA